MIARGHDITWSRRQTDDEGAGASQLGLPFKEN